MNRVLLCPQGIFPRLALPAILFLGSVAFLTAQPSSYRSALESWRTGRLEELKAPLGWLSLVGLYWLKEGDNTFGSARSNDLLFPAPAPERLGVFRLAEGKVSMTIEEGQEVLRAGKPVREVDASPTGQEAPQFDYGSLTWTLLTRGDRFGVRLWDRDHEERTLFDSVPYFEVNENWNLPAQFVPYDPPRVIKIDNVVGMKIDQQVEGQLLFNLAGKEYALDVFDGGPGEFFIIFADETTGLETYGGGRYLYIPRPDDQGRIFIDFNRAYNPPCAFTAYATCLLPPPQNRLPIAVHAGELSYGEH